MYGTVVREAPRLRHLPAFDDSIDPFIDFRCYPAVSEHVKGGL